MIAIINKKRWTKNNLGFSKAQKKQIDLAIKEKRYRYLDSQNNNLLHLSIICNEVETANIALKVKGLAKEKNLLGFTPVDLAHLLGRQSILSLLYPVKQKTFLVERKETIHRLNQEELEKLFQIRYIPTIKFHNIAIINWVIKKTMQVIKRKKMPREQKWYGNYYAKEIEEGMHADVIIKYINRTMGYGLFAHKNIKKKVFIAEYAGLVRRYNYTKDQKNSYCFEYLIADKYDTDFVIDAKDEGNLARFINHHDQGNVTPISVCYKGITRVILQANRDIAKGEQLLYDYGPEYWAKREKPSL